MNAYGYFVPVTEETRQRVSRYFGGASRDVDQNELLAFVFGTAQEFWERVYQCDGDYQAAVEFFALKAEIARSIMDGVFRVWEPGREEDPEGGIIDGQRHLCGLLRRRP